MANDCPQLTKELQYAEGRMSSHQYDVLRFNSNPITGSVVGPAIMGLVSLASGRTFAEGFKEAREILKEARDDLKIAGKHKAAAVEKARSEMAAAGCQPSK